MGKKGGTAGLVPVPLVDGSFVILRQPRSGPDGPAQDEMNRIDASLEVSPVSALRHAMARRDRGVVRPLSRVAGEPMTLALPGLLL